MKFLTSRPLVILACTMAAFAMCIERSSDASPAAARRRDVITSEINRVDSIEELVKQGDSQLWAEFVIRPVARVNLFSSTMKRTVLYLSSRFPDQAILVVYRRDRDRRYVVSAVERDDQPEEFFGEDDGRR